jgi:hypothetical protein
MNKYSKGLFIAIGLLTLVCLSRSVGNAQTRPDVGQLFREYQSKHLSEKIYLHVDKGFYLAGEILWFKMYCTDGTYNKPLDLSKVAYVELINEKKEPVLQDKIGLNKGSGAGSLYLPGTLKTGVYQLRAYTNWMKNYSPEFYFSISITIVNTLDEDHSPVAQSVGPDAYTVGFYPEGGNLVRGLQSKVAFQVLGSDGKGVDCEMDIIGGSNERITSAKPRKFGIGSFQFKPERNSGYKAMIRLPNGIVISKDLPNIFDSGYVIKTEDLANGEVKVAVSSTETQGNVQLFIYQGQQTIDSKELRMVNGQAEILLKKQDLPYGIAHFTLFDDHGKPLGERLYFRQPKADLPLTLSSDKKSYINRSRAGIEITLGSPEKHIASDMSVSVFRLDTMDKVFNPSIVSYLLLNAELKGVVESPEYYLHTNDAESIDNLLLTHGWRRFKWEDVLNRKTGDIKYLPEYLGHIINGQILNLKTNKPGVGVSNYLSVPGKISKLFIARSDTSGQVFFHTKDFYGPGEILAQNNYAIDSTYRIDIISPYSTAYRSQPISQAVVNPKWTDQLNVRNINVQVSNIFKGNNFNRYSMPQTDSVAFYGRPTKKYNLDDYTRFTTMNEVITEYIAEVQVQRENAKNKLNVFDLETHQRFTGDPLILLDGLPVFNDEKILAFDPLKVKRIETVSKKYSIGAGYFDGIVNFATYKGDMQGFEVDPRATVMNYNGLQLQREFYSPSYSTESQLSSTIPDFRDLLYWAPFVKTDANGKARVDFYTSDQTGKYAVVLQGLTSEGEPFSRSEVFEVTK